MPNKPRRSPNRRAVTHIRFRQNHAGTREPGARRKAGTSSRNAGAKPARLRIDIIRIGHYARFSISTTDTQQIIARSPTLASPKAAKDKLIELVKAIQADDFETYDYT